MAKSQDSSISYALLSRKQFLELLKQLKLNKNFSPDEMLRIAELIQNFDKMFYPLIVEEFANADSEVLIQKYEYLMKYLDYQGFTTPLIDLLNNQIKDFRIKRAIINVLKFYNVEFTSPKLKQFQKNEEELFKSLKIRALHADKKDLNNLAEIMQDFWLLEEGAMVTLVKELAREGVLAIPILELLLNTGINNVVNEIISQLGKIKNSLSLTVLEKAKHYLPSEYYAEVVKSIRRLNFMWITEIEKEKTDFTIEKTFLSYPAEFLSRYIMFWIKDDSSNHLIVLNVTKKRGISDFINVNFYLSKDEVLEKINRFQQELLLREVHKEYVKIFFSEGIRNNYVNKVPFHPLFPVISTLLPVDFIRLVPHNPSIILNKFEVNRLKSDKAIDWEKYKDKLTNIIKTLNWLIKDDRFKDIVRKWYMDSEKHSGWLDDLLVRKVLREIILPNLYDWKEMLFLLSDFMYNTGEEKELARLFVQLASTLNNNIEEMEQNELLKLLIIESKNFLIKYEED